MKVKPAEADGLLANPPAKLRAILLYGPDSGLVDERGRGLVRKIAGSLDDPFRVTELARRDLESDAARLSDELGALSFTGGRRVVRLRDATDGLSETIAEALSGAATSGTGASGAGASGGLTGFLVVEAGDLAGRSALRKLFEDDAALAAVPCYRDDEGSLATVIRNGLKDQGLGVAPDALAYLARNLGGDRQVTRRELEKLALYKTGRAGTSGGAGGGGSSVTLEDAEACIGDSANITQEDLAFAVAGGDSLGAERAFQRALAEGAAAVSVVRAVARHFQRLHQVAGNAAGGAPMESAVGRLRPPVFWKRRKAFVAQAAGWSVARLREAIAELTELEIALKGGDAGPDLLADRALLRLTVNAPTRRRSGAARR